MPNTSGSVTSAVSAAEKGCLEKLKIPDQPLDFTIRLGTRREKARGPRVASAIHRQAQGPRCCQGV